MIFTHLDTPIPLEECETVSIDGMRFYKFFVGGEERVYPSVTSILSYNPKKQKSLSEWRKRIGEENAKKIVNNSSRRGTSLHKICEKYIQNDINYLNGAMPDAKEMFLSLKPIIDQSLDRIVCQEQFLFSHTLKVAGRTDLIAHWEDELAVFDFKNSIKPKKEEWLSDYYKQLSAYAAMYYDMTRQPIKKGVLMIAVEGQDPQIFIMNPWNWIKEFHSDIQNFNNRGDNNVL